MPISSEIVGRVGESIVQSIDARWTMAYAAGLGDLAPGFLDTRARPDVLAHPLFSVCVEWPLFLDPRYMPTDLPAHERVRGVHFTHDLTLHRPIRAGMELTTRATIAKVVARRSGAYQLVRIDTVAADGDPVSTTWYGTLLRDVEVVGGDRALEDSGPTLEPAEEAGLGEGQGEDQSEDRKREFSIPVAANAAWVYTECARIWNPIHTDAAVAAAAGLPEPILHGTATLGLAVSRLVSECFDGDAERVVRIAGRFGAMVRMPSTLTLRMGAVSQMRAVSQKGAVRHDSVRFEVLEPGGGRAIRDGLIVVRR
jgi:acyl dehydratase